MNASDFLSGKAGLAGIQWALNSPTSRHFLRGETQRMLRQGYCVGPFHLTRAKYKPGRRLQAFFSLPVMAAQGNSVYQFHLAVSWEPDLDGVEHIDGRIRLQEEALHNGLLPVQRELWRDICDQGVRLQAWPLDPEFPQLVRLGDPVYAAGLFAALGMLDDPKRLPVITPIRYRPGERHVLRYEIKSTQEQPARKVYAKLYTQGEEAALAYRVAGRVAGYLAEAGQGEMGNRPEALSEADGVIFYPHAPGIPLSQQLNRSPIWLAEQLHIIGRALADLHQGPAALQAELKENTFDNEVKLVRRACEHIQVLLPETHSRILDILDKVQVGYETLPHEEPTFTHSDFKADHLLSTPQGLTLIDFDTCTLTDPAMDIGKFMADLEWWFTLKGLARVKEAQSELLKGYAPTRARGTAMDARLARARLYYILILVKIIARRAPLYHKAWADITNRMVSQAEHALKSFTMLNP